MPDSDDDGMYGRDDGSLVPFAQCTHTELLIVIEQLRRDRRFLRGHIHELLEVKDERVRRQAFEDAARAILAMR